MTLTELKELCEKLDRAGYGQCDVIRTKEDDINDWHDVCYLSIRNVIFRDNDIQIVSGEDLDDETEVEKVVCVW